MESLTWHVCVCGCAVWCQVEDAKGAVFRLPERGHYLTAGVGACTRNYDDHDARRTCFSDVA